MHLPRLEADLVRYFSIYALQHFFLPSPVHSHFINRTVLQRYMPVGGVRIEDDILITATGYENLTEAPKGDAMFDIIRGCSSSSVTGIRSVPNPSQTTSELPLARAPGCPLRTTLSTMQPLKRATTMPQQVSAGQRHEHSRRAHALNFRRSMTTDERIQHWRQTCEQRLPHNSSVCPGASTTICGSFSSDVKHTFLGDGRGQLPATQALPECSDCVILVQTLGRLRQNLTKSKQASSKHATEPRSPPTAASGRNSLHLSPNAAAQQPSRTDCEGLSMAYERPQDSPRAHTDDGRISEKPADSLKGRLNTPEPEQYYRNHELSAPTSIKPDIIECPTSFYAASLHSHDNPIYPTIRPQPSLPTRMRIEPTHDQRRQSNHTDDRDWMA